VIFFYCPDCKEELEGEDSIRGAKMKCPACFKEIEVPQAGVKVPSTGRSARRKDRDEHDTEPVAVDRGYVPGGRFIILVLVLGLLGVLAVYGIGYTLHVRAQKAAEARRPLCGACQGKGAVPCALCGGAKRQPCTECLGTGRRKNFRDEEETCFRCNGVSFLECYTCRGKGEYQCTGCAGAGRLNPK
jgi:hypothetical protein